jgi:DNA-binding NtrC family response regulator
VSEREAKADSKWSGSGTVLVVDDDEIVCKVTERILTKFGFTVVTSCSAETAAAAAKQHGGAIRAILLDISLPDLGGADVLKHMREAAGNVPIILMSGFNVEAATSDMTPGSFEGFLQKPFKGETLANKLREVLEKK